MVEKIMTHTQVRTRFAPSPTGYLHIGGLRTALFSWLVARHQKGAFILRIEDTDLERSTPESVQAILDGMKWVDLKWDEGPFYQTKRFDRYKEVIQQLLAEGKAYRCTCSKERLEKLRIEQEIRKEKPRYDGLCRELSIRESSQPFVVRFKNPANGSVSFDDQVCGTITVNNSELDDLILARSDGVPTYNFTVVVDDWDMGVTQVIRGTDHINNTPRQINLFLALGVTPPSYAHVAMILGQDGKKLSKRHGAVSVLQYEEEGFLPEALLNYLVRLGWSHGDQEIFSREEMIEFFDLKQVSKSAASFNLDKLLWLNQHYIKTGDPQRLSLLLKEQLHKLSVNTQNGPSLVEVVKLQAERVKTLKEMAERSLYFFETIKEYDPAAAAKNFSKEILAPLQEVRQQLSQLKEWSAESIHQIIAKVAEDYELKLGKLAPALRVAVTGNTISPSIDATLQLIGQAEVVKRLEQAEVYIETFSLTK